ncbi:hypothetical protein B0I35DRAFT_432163 [Stachybotrys elegans]|uniref:PH domain-containing protein n=1 Tax=Stachybotrys elegans TaxID=80388 RepID=A0A8K0WSG1_9HYPO|nr:hypothetical protein B0I35DRAFT_432163 [Stachybotrys elegans]
MGLERRLRRYEHIRDVMNSWDRDAQNSLMVVSLEADDDGQDLDISSVPRSQEPPRGFSFQLSCSSRRGKWDKRWVNLLDSGQIFVAKKPDAKPTDKDSTALCHLSDFDIYIPKESETRRRIRAPHKYCYAVKSQQKSIVFPDGENFVHFFSTDDSEVAHHFFALIHGWRSWYLANKLGQFEKKSSSTTAMPTRSATQKTTRRPTVTDNSYKLPLSTDDTPYTIGAFEPFLDLDRFNKPLEEFGKDLEPNAKSERTLSKRGHNPKAPQVKQQTKRPPVVDTSFSVSGLLGSAYEKRKQSIEASESTVTKDKEEGPFTGGSSLLNTVAITSPDTMTPAESKTWFPSAEEHSARNRSRTNASTNPPPAVRSQSTRSARTPRRPQTSDGPQARKDRQTTLVNLTNSFPQPPQWRDKGQSHSAKAPAGAPLINFATGGTMPGQFPVNGGPPRGFMRSPSGRSASSTYDDPSAPAAQAGSRSRSRSVTARHRALEDAPPVPPLPVRSLTRDALLQSGGGAVSRGRHMPEPLVSRAR